MEPYKRIYSRENHINLTISFTASADDSKFDTLSVSFVTDTFNFSNASVTFSIRELFKLTFGTNDTMSACSWKYTEQMTTNLLRKRRSAN